MPNKKSPPHILPTLICLVLVLGLSGSCVLFVNKVRFAVTPGNFFYLFSSEPGEFSVVRTDLNGDNPKTLPVPGEVTHATLISTGASAEPAVDVAAEEPRLILVDNTTAQILNLGTNTLGAQAQLSGRIQLGIPVAVSGDGAFAAAVVTEVTEVDHSVDLIDLSSMTRTGTIELPTGCSARGIAFLPGTNDFAVACSGNGAVRFYSVNGGAGSEQIREITGCEGARAVVFTADGQRGLFSCTSSVWVYDVLADSVVHTIEGFDSVLAMATTMDATRAYITNTRDDGGDLTVVDLATYDIVRTTEVGGFPSTVVVGPDDQRVYVLGTREVRGVTVTDKQGVELNFVTPPAFPITFLVVRLPALS